MPTTPCEREDQTLERYGHCVVCGTMCVREKSKPKGKRKRERGKGRKTGGKNEYGEEREKNENSFFFV